MDLGEKIGKNLKPGSIIALTGKIGAGKTVFAKGLARALGVTEEATSPSYLIINEYQGKAMPVYHIDTYRLSGNEDFFLTGAEELLYGRGVCIIEWPERIQLPDNVFYINIEILQDGNRCIKYGEP